MVDIFQVKEDETMKRPAFIRHYSELQDPDNACYKTSNSSELLSIGSPLGKKLGLKKIGVHHELLPPGRRTSWPHAESDEEEFIYVIEGNPDAWINGHIYRLNPGDAVAFPAGTGIAHTFINNTEKDVRLMVMGEVNKKENKIFFPKHPERNEYQKQKGTFWEGHPAHELGSHDGLPDKLRN